MKILVIDLLRIGDFLQMAPVLDGLKRRHPGARVDTLTFRGTERLARMIPAVHNWWTLDRDALQAGLGRADVPLFTSYDVLRERLREVSAENYDLVINLTHTEFSGFVAGYLTAREKLGLARNVDGRPSFHSPWFRYLDQHAQRPGADVFHHLDIFWQACGLDALEKRWNFARTAEGRAEVDALALGAGPLVVCQTLTSDERKNWGDDAWVEGLNLLRARAPDVQIVLLGAPNERARVEAVCARVPGTRAAIVSLDGALALLDRARVLITGDTSIKHLAAATEVRIVELSLGPSDHRRTGAYPADSYVMQSPASCAPCAFSQPCSQVRIACAEQIEPARVAEVASRILDGTEDALDLGGARTRVLRTRVLSTGFWFAIDLAVTLTPAVLESILKRCTWKFWLNQDFKNPVATYGTEGLRLGGEIGALVPRDQRQPILAHLDFMERALGEGPVQVQSFEGPDFVRRRQGELAREQSSTQREIQVKLIRSLKARLTEMA